LGVRVRKVYPEKGIIYDEIKIVVRKCCQRQADTLSAHLFPLKIKMDAHEFELYRIEYIGYGSLADEVQSEVRKMDSIVKLREKIFGK